MADQALETIGQRPADLAVFGAAVVAAVGSPTLPRAMGQFTFGSGRYERVAPVDTTGRTWEYIRRCPRPFDAIQVCLSVGQTAALNAVTAKAFVGAAAVPSLADADVTAASATLFQFGGTNNPDTPPSPAFQRRTYQWSDIMRLSSVPATDGLGGHLLALRAYLATSSGSGNVLMMGDTPGSDTFSAWEAHPSRPFRLRSKAAQWASSGQWSGMSAANSAPASTGPIGMVRLLYRGAVVNVVSIGDSTDDGRGTYLGDGPASKACSLLSNGSQVVYEHTNLGWSGATAQVIYQNLLDYLAGGSKGDVFFVPTFFTNNVGSGPIPSAGNFSIAWMQGYRAIMEAALDLPGVRAILQTSTPADFSVRNWGTSDALRIASDVETRALAGRGRVIFDKSVGVTGPVDGNGQQTIINSNDKIHQNDVGLAIEAVNAAAAIRRATFAPDGILAA